MKTDGETSLAITAGMRADGRENGERPERHTAVSKYFTGTYLAGGLAIGKLFNSIYFAPPVRRFIRLLLFITVSRWGRARRREKGGKEGVRGANLPERGWRAIIANNKRESHLIIMIVRLLSVAPSNNFVSR